MLSRSQPIASAAGGCEPLHTDAPVPMTH